MTGSKKRLLVEGWRGVSHSYAISTQWRTLALAKKDDLEVYFQDAPYFNPQWARTQGLFSPTDERVLAGLTAVKPASCDAVMRIAVPHYCRDLTSKKTLIYSTSEYKTLSPADFNSFPDFQATIGRPDVTVWTPSHWSAEGFYRMGFPKEQILVVPDGIDPATFYPAPVTRDLMRKRLGLSDFVFMCVGAMTPNKGIALLLKAFAAVLQKRPGVRLLLKGADTIYSSNKILETYLSELSPADLALVQKHCIYHGGLLSMADMAALYQVADAYVSPYLAEGFNLPVLEAAACGVPVICTAGGSTDDFVTDEFARKIDSKIVPCSTKGGMGEMLSPSLDHLIQQMIAMVDEHAWRQKAALAGIEHARSNFTWDIIAEQIVSEIF